MATKPVTIGTERNHLATARINFKNIVVAVDLSPASEKAVRIAASLAKEYGAKLFITHTLPESGLSSKKMKSVEERVGKFIQTVSFEDVDSTTLFRLGTVVEETEKVIDRQKADLLILATHGRRGAAKLLQGSRSESLFRHVTIPVLTVGPQSDPAFTKFHSVLLATDLTVRSFRAAQYAASLAQEYDASLTILHVLRAAEDRETIILRADALERMRLLVPEEAEFWCRPKLRTEVGDPAGSILKVADDTKAELIVMSVRHAELANRAPWTIASKVVSQAHCPVLTLRELA